jgi:thiol:disulfide interchange protein DsbD
MRNHHNDIDRGQRSQAEPSGCRDSLRHVPFFGSCLAAMSLVVITLLGFQSRALALESTARTSPRAGVTLVTDKDSVAPGDTVRIALRQKLAPHWHTYWKNPGDAGTPVSINLTLPDGVSAGEIQWPGPERISTGPVMSFGYEHEALFPITVTVPKSAPPGTTLPVTAKAEWLVCEKQCIPESGSFALDLPISPTSTPANADIQNAFAATDARTPIKATWPTRLTVEGAALALTADTGEFNAGNVKDAYFYPDDWGVVIHASPQQLSFADGKLNLAMEKGETFNADAPASGLLALTAQDGGTRWFAVTPQVIAAAPAGNPATIASLPLWQIALFAFLGGLLLNLMPCVFPVLAIKAVSVARLSGGELREIRLSGLFYTLGVLTAFTALAAVLLGLRASGETIGWGFQFQSPLFVAVMSWLLLAIGLNLSGVYEIGLGLTGAGQKLTHREGHLGSFLTGLLAVVVATPCTAPFMGVAIGAALAAPVAVSLALFIAMGLGLAAPYALLGLLPRLARLLPKPGRWMLRLRQAMAFPMYASAAWLVWVLAQQAGDSGVMIGLAGALLIAFAAWLYGIAQHDAGRGYVTRGLSIVAILALVILLPQLGGAPSNAAISATSDADRFTNARLAELRKDGKPVFVNMTAAWCITCLVNEKTTLSTATVKDALRERGVVYLKGDWTNRDPEITSFLRGFNRDGLPFYAYYPAGTGEPVVLPPVLTESLVLNEIRKTSVN